LPQEPHPGFTAPVAMVSVMALAYTLVYGSVVLCAAVLDSIAEV
jgi:hypothetical protein